MKIRDNYPRKLKVLQVHNQYQHKTGGEFLAAEMDKQLLESKGHQVLRYIRDNDEINLFGLFSKITLPFNAIWSSKSYREIESIIEHERPDIVNVHNFFPLISPSIFYAANKFNIPTIWTLHNYRLICAEGEFLRSKKVCEECLTKSHWRASLHACYRKSHLAPICIILMNWIHRCLGTWHSKIDYYFVLTEFGRNIFLKSGLSPERLIIRPNIIYPAPTERKESEIEEFALFLGQISEKKGVELLVDVWRLINYKLIMAGAGPLLENLKAKSLDNGGKINFLGNVPHQKAIELLKKSRFLLLPSLHNEGFPLVILEALALGVPVIASKRGPLPELIEDTVTGFLVKPGDKEDLASKINFAINDRGKMIEMGHNARKLYDKKYSIEQNYKILMDTYLKAIEKRKCY